MDIIHGLISSTHHYAILSSSPGRIFLLLLSAAVGVLGAAPEILTVYLLWAAMNAALPMVRAAVPPCSQRCFLCAFRVISDITLLSSSKLIDFNTHGGEFEASNLFVDFNRQQMHIV